MKNKEIIKAKLINTINGFYNDYQLPPMNISDSEWNKLLDVVEAHFLVHQIMNEYEIALNIIIRRALYFAQRTGDEEFSIEHLKRALQDLVAFHIYSDEIKAMQEEMNDTKIYKLTK